MIQPNYSLDKFLKKVAELPVVRQMVHEESTRTNAEILQARIETIDFVKSMEIQQAKARATLDSAEAALKAAEEKVKPYRERLIAAGQSYTDESRAYQAAAKSLQLAHGEQHVTQALYLLDLLRNQCNEKISALISVSTTSYFVDGQWRFRPISPEIKPALEKRKRNLEAIEQAYSAAKLLVMAEITPDELKSKVDALLIDAGYMPDVAVRQE
jgi:hypothetical protein